MLSETSPDRQQFASDARSLLLARYSVNYTTLGNAHRFIAQYQQHVRYLPSSGWWLWNGRHWHHDTLGSIETLALASIQTLYEEVSSLPDALCKIQLEHAVRSQTPAQLHTMLQYACTRPEILASPDLFDADPFLLTVLNGTIDLRTGQLQPHNPQDFITRLAPVVYDPAASSPLWERFISEVTNHDPDLQRYLQAAVGYSLTASMKHQTIFLLYGSGSNGKSCFLNAIRSVLGSYTSLVPTHFLSCRHTRTATDDLLASLTKTRMLVVPQISPHDAFDISFAERIACGDTSFLSATYVRSSGKLWISTRSLPAVHSYSASTWNRLKVLPFPVCFLGREDGDLPAKLNASAPAILSWAVQGCLLWQRQGLPEPACLQEHRSSYRYQQDELAAFLLEYCVQGPDKYVRAGDLYEAYRLWARFTKEKNIVDARTFAHSILARGFRRQHTRTGRFYLGLGLTDQPASLLQPPPPPQPASLLQTLEASVPAISAILAPPDQEDQP